MNLSRTTLAEILAAPNQCFEWAAGAWRPLSVFSETTGWVRTLRPTADAPTTVVAGFPMHRIVGTTPLADAQAKVRALGRPRGRVLDTATGLGYTAIELARTASEVVTIELDAAALELAQRNPWSAPLFDTPSIRMLTGDATEAVHAFADREFAAVLHDPPTPQLGGKLYFKRLLRRASPHTPPRRPPLPLRRRPHQRPSKPRHSGRCKALNGRGLRQRAPRQDSVRRGGGCANSPPQTSPLGVDGHLFKIYLSDHPVMPLLCVGRSQPCGWAVANPGEQFLKRHEASPVGSVGRRTAGSPCPGRRATKRPRALAHAPTVPLPLRPERCVPLRSANSACSWTLTAWTAARESRSSAASMVSSLRRD